ncbi:hypothetical protein [Botrimarina sp.]|uniref:hypothetical protein n=1 Tax=Botrimarina sp. TaxID=2795802 RepID=UPI0032ECD525
MRNRTLLGLVLVAAAGVAQLGCRACASGYDYASPVSGAACGACGGCRAGSSLSASGEPYVVAEAPGLADETVAR